MQKAPYVENFENLEIAVHNIAFSNSLWDIHHFDSIRGTAFSNIWINHTEYTEIIGSRGLTTSLTLIVRNQNDLKSVIICLGTFTTKQISINRTPSQELQVLTQYLFEKSNEYKTENKLKSVDGSDFEMPEFTYSQHHFESIDIKTLK